MTLPAIQKAAFDSFVNLNDLQEKLKTVLSDVQLILFQ
jgi:hypothetical protein